MLQRQDDHFLPPNEGHSHYKRGYQHHERLSTLPCQDDHTLPPNEGHRHLERGY